MTMKGIKDTNLITFDTKFPRLDRMAEIKPFKSMYSVDIQTGEIKHDRRKEAGYWNMEDYSSSR